LVALHRLGDLDAQPDLYLDELVALLARVFGAASASVSLVGTDGQWSRAGVGMVEGETGREVAFCDHTIRERSVPVVEDATQDPRFATNPSVTGPPFIRFYAGAPLVTRGGAAVGAVCVVDARVRTASPYQRAMLETVAQQVVDRLELRPAGGPAADDPGGVETGTVPPGPEPTGRRDEHLKRLVVHGSTGYAEADVDGVISFVNHAASRMLGYAPSEMVGRPSRDFVHPDDVLRRTVRSPGRGRPAGRRRRPRGCSAMATAGRCRCGAPSAS